MSRRQSSGFTGANAIPLGTRNKAIGAKRQFTSSPPRSYDDDMPRSIGSESGNNSAAAALKAAQAAAANLAKLANLKSMFWLCGCACWYPVSMNTRCSSVVMVLILLLVIWVLSTLMCLNQLDNQAYLHQIAHVWQMENVHWNEASDVFLTNNKSSRF